MRRRAAAGLGLLVPLAGGRPFPDGRAGASPPPDAAVATYEGTAMGSDVRIEARGEDPAACGAAVADALAEIRRLDAMMTDWKPESPLMDVNRGAGAGPVEVPQELFFLIRKSLEMSELTGGAFDVTWAGAGHFWNWRDPDPKLPDPAVVREALTRVGWRRVVLDEVRRTVILSDRGMRIGLGAIAPGYAGDLALAKMKARGIRNAAVDMSGDVVVAGTKDGAPWTIGIRDPRKEGEVLVQLPVSNAAVSTSGDYERFFLKDGKRYCHIIDPRSGYPADRCRSVTIIAPVLAFADALATGVFVLGPEEGMALVERLEGVEAVIVDADGGVRLSKGLQGKAGTETAAPAGAATSR